jgi:GntR family transcriptional repressor for pyruvate dehydrogenase complex
MSARVGTIEVPKSCDVLAARLRAQILEGRLAPGEALPGERDLVVETGLSRGSVREALRILEAEGLVQTRPGRYGGTVISRPSSELLARQVGSFAKGRGVGLRMLIETRESLEPMLARLAARHRTDADLDALEAAVARMRRAVDGSAADFLAANVEWHWAVALASGNELMSAFMASITGLIRESTLEEHVSSREVRLAVIDAHRRVNAAVRAGDAEAARRRMARHVTAYCATLLIETR